MIRLLVLLITLGCTITLVQSAAAQEPVATDTPPAPEPTRTPRPDEGTLIIHVINDLNRNGRRDAREPGLEGWRALLGCEDALVSLGPSDAEGTITYYLSHPNCVGIDVQFGWVLTSPRHEEVRILPGGTVTKTFLVRRVGERVQQVFGEVILNGLPAPGSATVDALVDGRSCSDATDVAEQAGWTSYSLYVLSAAERPGCADDAAEVAFTVDGTIAARRPFAPGRSGLLDLIAGPAPMRFDTSAPEGTAPVPYVGSVVCGEARFRGTFFLPANYYRVYVFPEALRSGCGASGRIVTVRAGGAVILATPWQEGIIYDLTVLTPVLPDAGSQPGSSDDGSLALGLAALAVAASALTVLLGWRLRRGQ